MVKRAFVVGSETERLSGALSDARRIALALREGYGFEVDLCVGPDATRASIAEGYRRLIATSRDGDAALFYYSGHGAFAEPADPSAAPPGLAQVQCIVPVDFGATRPGDFRGITAQELALWLYQLTARTKNATVVLDCCHAGGMSRGTWVRKSRPKPLKLDYATLRPHVELVLSEHRDEFARFDALGNPHAVRLVATSQRYVAWEYTSPSGESQGVLTEALLVALGEAAGHRVTWQALGDRVREYVLAKAFGQRPEVEGPLRRLLFETAEAEADGSLAVVRGSQPGRCILRGGRVHGVHKGDQYRLVAPSGAGFGQSEFGTAEVVRVDAAESRAEYKLTEGRVSLPDTMRALPLRSAAPSHPVRLEAQGDEREAIVHAIESAPHLRVIEGDEPGELPLAHVRVADGQIELLDPEGRMAALPLPYQAADEAAAQSAPTERPRVEGRPSCDKAAMRRRSLDELLTNLRRMAAAERLRLLEGEPTDSLPEGSVEVSWGRVERGEMTPLALAEAQLDAGDFVFVKVRNNRPDRQSVYVSILDIGIAKKTALLTRAWPGGYEVRYGHEYVLGRGQDGRLKGAPLVWPEGLPEDGPRPESVIVITSEGPVNLAPVEQPGLIGTRDVAGNGLEQLVSQAQNGTLRDVGGDSRGKVEGYLVHHIEFYLGP